MPPEPFHFIIPHTDTVTIIFNNYGSNIPKDDALDALFQVNIQIMIELHSRGDIAVGASRVWIHDLVTIAIDPEPPLRLSTLGLILSGMMVWGEDYGFIKADMLFTDERYRLPFTLGTGQIFST